MPQIFGKQNKTITQWMSRLCRRLFKILHRLSQWIQFRASLLCFFIPQRIRDALARFIEDLAFLIDDLPKKSIWQMTGSGLRILFVGDKISSYEILRLLMDANATLECIGQTWTFGLSRRIKIWLDEGFDLVICELGYLHWFRPQAPIAFNATQYLSQLVPYPEENEGLPSGTRFHEIRRLFKLAQKAGYEWRFSRSRADYDYFYERLYEPFVQKRHGQLAQITPYPFHWKLFIQGAGGGLVMATQGGSIKAGAVCIVVDKICYGLEMGFIDGDTSIYKQGVKEFLFWAVATWGKQQGAILYNLGESLAWRSNNNFRSKARLGAKVIRNKFTHRTLAFSANHVGPELRERVNNSGFIYESGHRFYGLMMDEEDTPLDENRIQKAIKRAKKDGLSGICVTAPGAQSRYYE